VLPEELDVDTVAREVAVAEEADHLVRMERAQHLAAGRRRERNHAHPDVRPGLHEPVEQLWWVDQLGDHRDLVPLQREPRARQVPVAEVGQRQDRAVPLGDGVCDLLDSVALEMSADPLR
jgi:hypothetical protein